MKLCLLTLSYLILLTLLIVSGKVNGKAVARRHSIRNDTDSSCNQDISNIITAFNSVKRDLEELKRSTDRSPKSKLVQSLFKNFLLGISSVLHDR